MHLVADRSVVARPTAHRELFADAFAWRLTMLGAAAFGFLVTFIALDHEIHTLTNVMLPLLAIVPAYLLLMSLNMWWAARTTAQFGQTRLQVVAENPARLRGIRVLTTCCGLAFGIIVALWYVHSVSK
jgi:predicted outer membrane lipoprotein